MAGSLARLAWQSICANGALIGYSAYAVSIKGSYEEPSQTMFLINREYSAKTAVMPVFVKNPVF